MPFTPANVINAIQLGGTSNLDPYNIEIHPRLRLRSSDPENPYLHWDISHDPVTSKLLNDAGHLHTPGQGKRELALFSEPAVYVPSNPSAHHNEVMITINSGEVMYWVLRRWGAITVQKPSGQDVLVRDVLEKVHEYFQVPLTAEEIQIVKDSGDGRWDTLLGRMERRMRASHQLYEVESRAGPRRIDLAGSSRWFKGLTPILDTNATWALQLDMGRAPSF